MQNKLLAADPDVPPPQPKPAKKASLGGPSKDIFGLNQEISAIACEPLEPDRNPAEFLSTTSMNPQAMSVLNRAFMEDSKFLGESIDSPPGGNLFNFRAEAEADDGDDDGASPGFALSFK